MKNFVLFCLIFSLCSCAVHSGLTDNSNIHNTTVQLTQANYKVISFVSGSSTVEYFLGIGGINNPAQIQAARIAMLKDADLIGKPRAIINETVEIKRSTFLLWTEIQVTVSAHVIEFQSNQSNSIETPTKNNLDKEKPTMPINNVENSTEKSNQNKELYLNTDKKTQLTILNEKLKNNQIISTVYSIELIPELGDFVLFDTKETGVMIGIIYEISCERKMCPCKVEVISESGELKIFNLRFVDLVALVQLNLN